MSMTAEQLGTPSAVTLTRSDATRVRHALESLGLETPICLLYTSDAADE